jgi:glycosyltransferase involved in cell wall biosynthesis
MKVALVHDWLIHMRGGEKVLEALAEMYPDAVIYTLFYDRSRLSPALARMKIRASFLQAVPGIKRFYRWLLPFFPRAIRTLEIGPVDLVISSTHCVAKAVRVPPGAVHLSYVHTPMRYLWGFEDVYLEKYPAPLRWVMGRILGRLRRWDLETNAGVHEFAANSANVRDRIRKFYGREAAVVCPPFDDDFFTLASGGRGDYYLVVSAFVPYKRVDVVIRAFNHFGRKLIVVGSGPLRKRYQKLRESESISFVGGVDRGDLKRFYSEARALIFPTEEDFGIVPLEAQACGTPVIAFGRGGARETVTEGIFFGEQTPESVREAVLRFEQTAFDAVRISESVRGFGREKFKTQMAELALRCVINREKYVTQ